MVIITELLNVPPVSPASPRPTWTCANSDIIAQNDAALDAEGQMAEMRKTVGTVKDDGRLEGYREGRKEGYAAGFKEAFMGLKAAQAQDSRAEQMWMQDDAISGFPASPSPPHEIGFPASPYIPHETGEQYNARPRVRPNPQFTNPLAPGTAPHPSRVIICNTYGNQTSCY
jgi:hypothetical protein